MPKTIKNSIITFIKKQALKRKGIVIHNNCQFGKVEFKGKGTIEPYCRLMGAPNILIGNNFYINCGCHFLGNIEIGDDVLIGPKTVIWGRDHGTSLDLPINKQPHKSEKIVIGNNVWIGANVTILKGVTINDGVIIGAGSVVTKSIPKNTIAVGNPAKVIKTRV